MNEWGYSELNFVQLAKGTDVDILDQFAETLNPDETEILAHVRQFIEWHAGSTDEFTPRTNDDVALRTYLMEMKINGVRAKSQRVQMASLRRFYDWAESAGYLFRRYVFRNLPQSFCKVGGIQRKRAFLKGLRGLGGKGSIHILMNLRCKDQSGWIFCSHIRK